MASEETANFRKTVLEALKDLRERVEKIEGKLPEAKKPVADDDED